MAASLGTVTYRAQACEFAAKWPVRPAPLALWERQVALAPVLPYFKKSLMGRVKYSSVVTG
jgi:hypothetical protein